MKDNTTMIMRICVIALISCIVALLAIGSADAEQWTLEAGATTYDYSNKAIGWYEPNTTVNIIGVHNGQWQTSDDLFIEPLEARKHLIGTFLLTWYTPSPSENGGGNLTALGDRLTDVVDYAIAVDPKVIKYNSKVYIDGVGWRVARDCGGAIKGNHIDVLSWHIPSYGKCYRKVWGLK